MTRRRGIVSLALLGAGGLSGCLAYPADVADPPRYFYPQVKAAAAPAPDGPAPRSNYPDGTTAPDPHARPPAAPAPAGPPARSEEPTPAPAEEKPPDPPRPPPAPEPSRGEVTLASAAARPDPPLVGALRCLLEKHPPEEALAFLDGYDVADREQLWGLLQLVARRGELRRATPQEVARALDQLEALAREMRPRAALVLEKLCFCRPFSVDNFGLYEPLEEGHPFRAAAPGYPGERVQVYAEVRNLAGRPVGDHVETVLKGKLEIRAGGSGPPIKEIDLGCLDRSRSPRRDFFVNFHFDTPRLPPGSYTLWVEVKDVTPAPDGSARPPRVARRSLDFQVVGDGPPPGATAGR
jgi:hypothetical protein